MPPRVSHPTDVPLCARVCQRVLWLGDPAAEGAGPGERPMIDADSGAARRPGRRRGQSAPLGGPALRRRAVWLPSGRALDAPSGAPGRAATAAVADEALQGPAQRNPESSRPGLPCRGAQHQMGHRQYLHADSRTLALPLCRAGCIFRARGGLLDEPASGPPVGRPSGADGALATARQDPRAFCTRIEAVSLPPRNISGSWTRITSRAAGVPWAAVPTMPPPRASSACSNGNE
jgi:hypothetical protein